MLRGRWTYLGLGTNLGDRGAHLSRAVDALGSWIELRDLQCSGVYEAAFVGDAREAAQPDYWNLCLRALINLEPSDILERTQTLEQLAGRRAASHREARELDIDLLAHGPSRCQGVALTLPHPRLEERRFVLQPLIELDADLILPSGSSLSEALTRPEVAAQRVCRLGELEELSPGVAEAEK
jgi:2-amino-4-hydroxy-6-hydroxymethyldihydropteridine diphosphokinase